MIIPTPPLGHSWESLMTIALKEATKAAKKNEVPVGALIVSPEGEILSKAYNKTYALNNPIAHAEILALEKAAKKIKNCRLLNNYLVVTLEPCIMCLGAIREARIKGIIFGAYDKKAGYVCSIEEGTQLPLTSPKPWYMGGIHETQCQDILKKFFQNKR